MIIYTVCDDLHADALIRCDLQWFAPLSYVGQGLLSGPRRLGSASSIRWLSAAMEMQTELAPVPVCESGNGRAASFQVRARAVKMHMEMQAGLMSPIRA